MLRILGAASYIGQDRQGVESAPKILRQLGLTDKLREANVDFIDDGDLNCHLDNTSECCECVRNLHSVVKLNKELKKRVALLRKTSDKVLVIGGEHSIAIGTVAASLIQDSNLGLIWFDAHGDINTEETTPSGNAHGMPVAALIGLCKSVLNDIAQVRLPSENVYWVGVRDLDPGELNILNELGISDHIYSAKDIRERGMASIMHEINIRMRSDNIQSIHLSFDVDGMDPSIVSATGTKVANGLSEHAFEQFVECLQQFPPLISLDFVEYNPNLDGNGLTGEWCVKALCSLTKVLTRTE